jgi:anti-sigma factor RsiW
MNCQEIQSRIADALAGELTRSEQREMERHLATCADCTRELGDLNDLWLRLGLLPEEEPSERLRQRFYQGLAAYEAEQAESARPRPSLRSRFAEWRGAAQFRRLAVAAPALLFGLALGVTVGGGWRDSKVDTMREEVDSLSRLVTLSLLQQSSASERLMGVSYGRVTAQRDERVVGALIEAAIHDPSVNVRLAAIDALIGVGPAPRVADRLERSIDEQSSPLVQIAVIDYLLASQPGRQEELRQRLLADEGIDEEVKQYLVSAGSQI